MMIDVTVKVEEIGVDHIENVSQDLINNNDKWTLVASPIEGDENILLSLNCNADKDTTIFLYIDPISGLKIGKKLIAESKKYFQRLSEEL